MRVPPKSEYLKHPVTPLTVQKTRKLETQEDWFEGKVERVESGKTPRYISKEINKTISTTNHIRDGQRLEGLVHALELGSVYRVEEEPMTKRTDKVLKINSLSLLNLSL